MEAVFAICERGGTTCDTVLACNFSRPHVSREFSEVLVAMISKRSAAYLLLYIDDISVTQLRSFKYCLCQGRFLRGFIRHKTR